ncbi:MAG: glycosyltransferase family 87 protein [Candidatus Sulfotelmatobacter sp.]
MQLRSAAWLTTKRLRAHATILAVCWWSFYLWTIATPGLRDRNGNIKGTDFLHFYTLGFLADAHRGADLYDISAQAALAAQRVPQAAGIRYLPLYPPQVSILFAPFAYLSYPWALALWWTFSTAIYAACCHAVWRVCPNLRGYGRLICMLAIAYPGFFHLIAWGQTSALALACFTAAFLLLRERREFLAGLALGCLIFKPQLALAAAIVFVALGTWKVIAGAAISAAAELAVGVLYYGMQPLRNWFHVLRNVDRLMPLLEPKPYQTHSLRTFWTLLLPPGISLTLYVLSALVVLGLTIACWRRKSADSLALPYSALLLATVLVAPHLTVYDLVILAPAFLLLADWLLTQPKTVLTNWSEMLLYFSYVLPLLGFLAIGTHLQLSVVAMCALLYVLLKLSEESGDRLSRAPLATAR